MSEHKLIEVGQQFSVPGKTTVEVTEVHSETNEATVEWSSGRETVEGAGWLVHVCSAV